MRLGQSRFILASAIVTVAMMSLIGLFFIDLPDKNKDLLNFFLGGVVGWSGQVISHYFGNQEKSRADEQGQK